MLSLIERVIFLKQVPFFKEMTIEQLRILANISEETSFGEETTILAEGDLCDSLHVVVSGRVSLQRQNRRRRSKSITRIATLTSRDYFAEYSLFDNKPNDADAIALDPTSLLLVRQQPLMALIKHQPDLSLVLLRVLSQRLREANDKLAQRSTSKPKQLFDLYDEFK